MEQDTGSMWRRDSRSDSTAVREDGRNSGVMKNMTAGRCKFKGRKTMRTSRKGGGKQEKNSRVRSGGRC